jgi:hypothetical protein
MLNLFIDWAKAFEESDVGKKADARLKIGELPFKRFAHLDVDSASASGRIGFWETGEYVAQIVALDGGKSLYDSTGVLTEKLIETKHFADFFAVLGIK